MMRLTDTIARRAGRMAFAALCALFLCWGLAGCAGGSDSASDRSATIEEEETPLDARLAEQEAALAEEERATDASELGYVPGQIIVVYEENATDAEREEAIEAIGAEEDGEMAVFEGGDVSSVAIDDGMTVETAVREAEREDAVKYAVPNYLVELFDEPAAEAQGAIAGDDMAAQQWYLDFVRAPQAWQLLAEKGVSKPVKVAVLDTGASLTHADLKNVVNRTDSVEVVWTDSKKAESWKTIPLRGDGYTNGGKAIDETSGHGTHVAGTIAAQAGNGGVVGVASGAGTANANKLVDLVVIDAFSLLVDDGAGNKKANASLMDLVFAMEDARDKGCKVISMSLGMQITDTSVIALFDNLCKELSQKNGILVVAAAGNTHNTVKAYPAACDAALSVISVSERAHSNPSSQSFLNPAWGKGDDDIVRSYFSSYGSWCDISAPGENIYSTGFVGGATNTYVSMQGTSMATPVVSAVAAMVMAADPSLTGAQVKDILCKTATDVNTKGKDDQSGYGVINAEAAVAMAMGKTTQTNTSTSTSKKMADAQVTATSVAYTGVAQTPKVTVKIGGATLKEGTDYSVSYKTATMKNAGTYTITVTGKGAYSGTKTASFVIQPASLSSASVTAPVQTYTGSSVTPQMTVTLRGAKLTQGTDFTVAYSNNRAVGTATATVTGKGNYTGTAKGTFTIQAAAARATTSTKSSSTASPGAASGSSTSPVNKATSPTNNSSASTPVSVAKTNLAAASISGVGSYYTYTGNPISPYPVLRYAGQLLRSGVDYTVGFSNNRALGTATVTMTGMGSYKGTVQMHFTIGAPQVKTPTALKVKAAKKAFTASWKRATGNVSGYQLQYSTSKKFTQATTHTVSVPASAKKTLSKAVKKLKAKKTYYVRVCTTYTVGDQVFTSAWSKAVKVKIKK